MGIMQRRKGHNFERFIANKLKPIFPNAERQLEYQESEGVDLKNTGKFRIQCKCQKKYVSISNIKEIQSKDGYHCLITQGKGINYPPVAVLYLDDFIELLEKTLKE